MLEILAFENDFTIPIRMKVPIWGKKLNWDKVFAGEMFFFYQNKSILGLIGVLFNTGNLFVGIIILLFSIINPILKLLLSLVCVFNPKLLRYYFFDFVVNKLGKWSMADVMVASVFLAFLSFQNMSNQIETDSNTLLGIYFFSAFVIVSLISSHFISMALKKKKLELSTDGINEVAN